MTARERNYLKNQVLYEFGYYWEKLNRRRSMMLYYLILFSFYGTKKKMYIKKIDLKKKSTS